MNKYKFLAVNTVLLFLSTFSSKFLTFLLMPIYTSALTTAEYNAVNLMMQTANIMIPIASFGMANAIIRFGLDKNYSKHKVFTIACNTYLKGFVLSLAFFPIIQKIEVIGEYVWFLYLYLFASCLRTLVQQFTRARAITKLYAADGLLTTINTLFLVWLFLIQLKLGPIGYILAIIGADLFSALFLSVISGAFKYYKLKANSKKLAKEMLKYCIPFIPNSIFWWITNVSDQYLVSYMVGESVAGLYAIAYKIPGIIVLCSTVFTEAWQISAVSEKGKSDTSTFFKNVFKAYQGAIFIAAAYLIMLVKPLNSLMVSESYYESWIFIPILIIATVFSCFSSFLSSIYMVNKDGKANLYTMMVGAFVNIGLNVFLIPAYGAQGAAISTLVSYFTVFAARALGTKKIINMKISAFSIFINLALSLALSFVVITELQNWIYVGIGITLIITAYNFSSVYGFIKNIIKIVLKKKSKKA